MAICAYFGPANSTSQSKVLQTADVLEILLLVRGVDAEEEGIVRHFVDQDIVHEAAVFIKQAGVLRLPVLQFRDGVGGGEVHEFHGFRAANLDLAHVADVEHTYGFAHGMVLIDEARVLDGHVPAAEIDHLRARGAVHLI